MPDHKMETEAQTKDVMAQTLPWLRRLPSPQELKALKAESSWNESAAKQLAEALEKLSRLVAAAHADNHEVLFPTHAVERNGEIIGYASIGAVPMINLWMDSKKGRPRESMMMLNMVENEAARMGFKIVCVPCSSGSPFRKLMDGKFGYSFSGESGFFLKTLQ